MWQLHSLMLIDTEQRRLAAAAAAAIDATTGKKRQSAAAAEPCVAALLGMLLTFSKGFQVEFTYKVHEQLLYIQLQDQQQHSSSSSM
jgi:hypothetical protein